MQINIQPLLIKPKRIYDDRGFFSETYNKNQYQSLGIDFEFVQDNHSYSEKVNTLRGLHFQCPPFEQGKLVSCSKGEIFDVAVDLRKDSENYGKWESYILSASNGFQLFIPPGFAHGFLTLVPNTEVRYKCTNFYNKDSEGSIKWDDIEVAIPWPITESLVISEKDASAVALADFSSPFTLSDL